MMKLHVEIIKREFEKRVARNPRYSLRTFASRLGIHPSALSRILAGKQTLSAKASLMVAKQLDLSETEKRRFLHSVAEAKERLEREKLGIRTARAVQPISRDALIAESYVLGSVLASALMELTKTHGFSHNCAWIADRLSSNEKEIQEIVDALVRNGILEISGDNMISQIETIAQRIDAIPAIKLLHQTEVLERAMSALETDNGSLENHLGLAMRLDPLRLEEARVRIKHFMEELSRSLDTDQCSEVYQLGVQFYPLTKKINS